MKMESASVDMRHVYLQMLFHLNEDFDNDLLSDCIHILVTNKFL